MNVIIANHGDKTLPVISEDGQGFADALYVDETITIDAPVYQVVVLGDKPGFFEALREGLGDVLNAIVDLLRAWHTPAVNEVSPLPEVKVSIKNSGLNQVRVILGNNANDIVIDPGTLYEAVAPGYIELRELGV